MGSIFVTVPCYRFVGIAQITKKQTEIPAYDYGN
jgi:hypothetical protein